MTMSGVQSGMVGMALFDMYINSVRKARHQHKLEGSPLVAAATQAFEAYIQSQEVANAAQIAGVAAYALNAGGGSVSPVTTAQMAPFMALNILA
jgi:hypothetical protein